MTIKTLACVALMVALVSLMVAPVSAYTYTYGVPYGTQICVKSNYVGGVSDYWAAWFTNTSPTTPGAIGSATFPFNSTYWTSTQTNHWTSSTSQCYQMLSPYKTIFLTQNNGSGWDSRYGDFYYNTSEPVYTPGISFTCSPLTQARTGSTALVTCTDASTNTPIAWNWTIKSLATGGTMTSAAQNPTFNLADIGSYNVTLTAFNTAGNATLTKGGYVSLTLPGAIKTWFQAVDGQSNGRVWNANIYLKDMQTGVWTNGTSLWDGTTYILTNATATINAQATATGYASVSRPNLTPCAVSDTCLYELIMWPSSMLPAPGSGLPGDPGVGNVNLIVEVNDKTSSAGIYMAQVSVSDPTGATQASYTNDAGVKIFSVKNSSTIYVTASKTGYSSLSKTTSTTAMGPDTVRLELQAAAGSTTPTPVVTDSSGNIVPASPVLTNNQKDDNLMALIRDNAPNIIMLFILFTIMYMLKGLF